MIATSKRYLWVLLVMLLTACSPGVTTAIPTGVDTNKVSTQGTATVPVTPMVATQPTETNTLTALPTRIQSTSIPTSLPQFPLDGYVMVFTKDGDLYFQGGNNAPVQLTHSEEKAHSPILSDDNQKMVFFRGNDSAIGYDTYLNIYSVNTDGSTERALISPQWLAQFGEGALVSSNGFIPKTHQLMFMVVVCGSETGIYSCANGLFLADTDTGHISQLLAPGKIGKRTFGGCVASPDGKMIAVIYQGHIEILGMNGKVIQREVMPYTLTSLEAGQEFLPEASWLPDSSGMIIAVPTVTHSGAYSDRTYTVWRYTVANDQSIQIPLDNLYPTYLSVTLSQIETSPDGNWILYSHPSGTTETALHLGNLVDGHAQFYTNVDNSGGFTLWSPDSKHFGYGDLWMGSISGPPVPIQGIFLEWIDATHFTYVAVFPKIVVGEIVGDTILTYDLPGEYLLIKPKR